MIGRHQGSRPRRSGPAPRRSIGAPRARARRGVRRRRPRALDLPASISTAACPIVSIGCRTVVNGRSVQVINAESSKPTTEMRPGRRDRRGGRPGSCRAPSGRWRRSRRSRHARSACRGGGPPPARSATARRTCLERPPEAAMYTPRRPASGGTVRGRRGPSTRPIRSWPSEPRCP